MYESDISYPNYDSCSYIHPGLTCELDVDECNFTECVTHASCVNTHGSYLCQCHYGYEGDECDVFVDFCESDPCFLHSNCSSEPLVGFNCTCHAGFYGKLQTSGQRTVRRWRRDT